MQDKNNLTEIKETALEYKITLKKGGVPLLEGEKISKKQFLRILQIVEAEDQGLSILPDEKFPANNFASGSDSSPREYLNSVNAKSGPELVVAILSYLKRFFNKAFVGPNEIKDQILRSGEPVPSNLAQDLRRAVSRGWVAPNNGLYYITNTGEEVLTNGFKSKSGISAKKRRKGIKLTPTIIRPQIEALEVEPLGVNLPNFWDLHTKSDRLLWILNYAKDKSFDRLNFKEISVVASKLGDNIIPRQVTSLATTHRKKNRLVMPTEAGTTFVKILEPGIIYLKSLKGGVAESE